MISLPQPNDQAVVLRSQLPLPRPYIAPRTTTEQRLAEIWSTVLSMDCVGVEDGYYDLGGDSFLATTMFALIEEAFHITAPMALLVEAPTIAQLAPKIDALIAAGTKATKE